MITKTLSKHQKYKSFNPISKILVLRFITTFGELIKHIPSETILDVGCGEGLILHSVKDDVHNKSCFAIDVDPEEVKDAKNNIPFCTVKVGSIYEIDFADNFADLVICSEVLEHIEIPEIALNEIHRVTSKYALLSVPNEPLWRILNMVRFKYWRDFGNTPDHKNHWSMRSFRKFIGTKFKIVESIKSTPWNIILCEKSH